MPIRRALPADTPTMATTAASAYTHSTFYTDLLHPHLATYPWDWTRKWQRAFRASMHDSTKEVLVAVDGPTGRVVGVAEWERRTASAGAAGGGRRILRPGAGGPWGLVRKSIALQNYVSELVWPDRSADGAGAAALAETGPLIAHVWEGERAETWYLRLLCVEPGVQGRGFGGQLVEWGIRRAEEEGVCASLICADGKEGFYKRRGFTVEGGRANVGVLAGMRGGAILFTEVGKGGGEGGEGMVE